VRQCGVGAAGRRGNRRAVGQPPYSAGMNSDESAQWAEKVDSVKVFVKVAAVG
jgi:hypothetical protein